MRFPIFFTVQFVNMIYIKQSYNYYNDHKNSNKIILLKLTKIMITINNMYLNN